MKNAALFDLGGTLAYYYDLPEFPTILRQGSREVDDFLRDRDLPRPSQHQISRRVREEDYEATDYRVRPPEERLARIFQIDRSILSDELAMGMCRSFMRPIFERGRLYEDALPTLFELKERGFKTAIVSNTSWGSPASLWREELDRLGLTKQTKTSVFCRDIGWRKPSKRIFEFTLEKMNANPQDCVFVGDHPRWDIEGPHAVGIEAILIDRRADHLDLEETPVRSLREVIHRLETD